MSQVWIAARLSSGSPRPSHRLAALTILRHDSSQRRHSSDAHLHFEVSIERLAFLCAAFAGVCAGAVQLTMASVLLRANNSDEKARRIPRSRLRSGPYATCWALPAAAWVRQWWNACCTLCASRRSVAASFPHCVIVHRGRCRKLLCGWQDRPSRRSRSPPAPRFRSDCVLSTSWRSPLKSISIEVIHWSARPPAHSSERPSLRTNRNGANHRSVADWFAPRRHGFGRPVSGSAMPNRPRRPEGRRLRRPWRRTRAGLSRIKSREHSYPRSNSPEIRL